METWRDAIGFESYYEVSNYGNVRRKGKTNSGVDRTVTDEDITTSKKFLFGVGNGFIDFA